MEEKQGKFKIRTYVDVPLSTPEREHVAWLLQATGEDDTRDYLFRTIHVKERAVCAADGWILNAMPLEQLPNLRPLAGMILRINNPKDIDDPRNPVRFEVIQSDKSIDIPAIVPDGPARGEIKFNPKILIRALEGMGTQAALRLMGGQGREDGPRRIEIFTIGNVPGNSKGRYSVVMPIEFGSTRRPIYPDWRPE